MNSVVKIENISGTYKREFKGNNLILFPDEYIVFDIETTGLDPVFDEIIEIGAIKVKNNQIIDEFNSLIKPKRKIDEFITELTGITNEMVENAPGIEEVLPKFVDYIKDTILVGHNVNFDINFVYDNCLKLEMKPISNNFVDTMRISRRFLSELPHHRLIDLADYFKINIEGNHRASKDAYITNDAYIELKNIFLKKYSSVEEFIEEVRQSKKSLKASDFTTTKTEFDENNLLFDKNIAITGVLANMQRKEAMQIITDLGGHCQDNVTNDTNFLILGNNDYNSILKGSKSSKLLKAEDLKLKGNDIEIISENVFYDVINDYVNQNSIQTPPSNIPNNPLLYKGEQLTDEEINLGKFIKNMLLESGQDCTYLRFTKYKNGKVTLFFSSIFLTYVLSPKANYIIFWEYALDEMGKSIDEVANFEIKGEKVFKFDSFEELSKIKDIIIFSYKLEREDAEDQI